ncbi:MAG: prephenate dehydrogenase/arogenate dehydrogenase family protein [Acidobacteria bacterium]|nr:MAG: prephenate dehydrogenase/arogenate dehydrogenase family protein [Acidobacteriota bacterium]
MKNITIYGTGLIGGSFALALKRAFPTTRIAGVDRSEVLARAQRLKIIDVAGPQPADFVVLAAPVGDILELLDQFSPDETLITDVGSTKAAICSKAEQRGLRFIGGHPMAGLEQSGPEAASADLLHDAPFFLCPVRSTPHVALERMQDIIRAIGAVPHVISPENHDRLVAQISHLPQIISSLLADHTAAHKDLAGPGLRSMTRLAGSPFHVWRDIFKTSGFFARRAGCHRRRAGWRHDHDGRIRAVWHSGKSHQRYPRERCQEPYDHQQQCRRGRFRNGFAPRESPGTEDGCHICR